MKMEEELLKAGLAAVKEAYGEQIQEAFGQEVIVPERRRSPWSSWPTCTMGLEEEFGYTVDDSEKGDLTTEAERLSYEWVKKHYATSSCSSPITPPRSAHSTTCATRTVCPRATT